ncbi:MAG TPA: retroviral-like aspartic protease family protein [Chthoniobacterales bacterium]|jgi:predicted aspartyl protease
MKTTTHRFSLGKILAALAPLGLLPAHAAAPPTPQIPGYQMVQADQKAVNRIVLTVYVNGHPESFLVDTGASRTLLANARAAADGVKLTNADSRYGQYAYFKGETFRVGTVDSLSTGSMNFGAGPIMLFDSNKAKFDYVTRSRLEHTGGFLGLDVLMRYKTIINTRTRQLFFLSDPKRPVNLAVAVAQMGFTRLPLHVNEHHSLIVDCTLNGTAGHMLIDTGAFFTHINAVTARAVHLPAGSTEATFQDVTGQRHLVDVANVRNLHLGTFALPEQPIFVTDDPVETAGGPDEQVFGLLGDDVLAHVHGIIDLTSMSLFVK